MHNLGIFTPTWFTCATFMSNNDHHKFFTGTKSHQVRLYNVSAQCRPVLSFDFRETAITATSEDPDGHRMLLLLPLPLHRPYNSISMSGRNGQPKQSISYMHSELLGTDPLGLYSKSVLEVFVLENSEVQEL